MKYLSDRQIIKELQTIEQIRFDDEDRYDAKGSVLPHHVDICTYADICNVKAYRRIYAIITVANRPVTPLLKRALYEMVNQVNTGRPYQPKQYLQYFKHAGFSAYGMSHVFDALIDTVDRYDEHKMKIFARLGA